MSLNLRVMTPQGTLFEDTVESFSAPGGSGYFGVLPSHAPMVSSIGTGVLKIEKDGNNIYFVIISGLAEISSTGTVVLADIIKKVAGPGEAEIELQELIAPTPTGH